jgi:hypothetical protein
MRMAQVVECLHCKALSTTPSIVKKFFKNIEMLIVSLFLNPFKSGDMNQVLEHLLSKKEALSSNPRTAKKFKKF